jgi:hypothetical protein
MDPKLVEQWLRLTADAFKGADEARKAFDALGKAPLSPEAFAKWVAAWLPGTPTRGETPDFGEFQKLVEEGWNTLGVVPRYRHLELLKRYEELKTRLEEAETTVRNLREILAETGREQEAAEVLDRWEEVTRKALDVQAEWAQTWTEGLFGKPSNDKEK